MVPKIFGPRKLKPNKMGPKGLVKIGSATAKIYLMWTNIAQTNVA